MAKINPVELQKHLKGVDYPVSKGDLLSQVKDEDVRSAIEQLPDETYGTPADVSQALGKIE